MIATQLNGGVIIYTMLNNASRLLTIKSALVGTLFDRLTEYSSPTEIGSGGIAMGRVGSSRVGSGQVMSGRVGSL